MENKPLILSNDTEEGLKQRSIIKDLRQNNKKLKKMYIGTFGCQMNFHDSEKLKGILEEIGYIETEKEDDADLVIYNTCTVRENASQRVFGRLGYLKTLKRKNPNLLIGICGCMTQQESILEQIKTKNKFVDIVFGTHNIYKMAELLQRRLVTGKQVIDVWKEYHDIVEDLPCDRLYKHKALVNIIMGCNNFCTYCIVPYTRGRERSRTPEDIIKEVENLANDGVVEITLLGQNVNSYGKNLPNPISFAKLLQKISEVDGIKRIKFMTSHPKDLSDELIDVIATNEKVCNSVHLPFQSGSTRLLKKMNRRYTKEKYLDLVKRIKNKVPNIGLTTDIMVGFPGETEEDFQDTLDVVKQVEFDLAFTFIYSKRTGTPAAEYEDQVPEDVVKERFNRLLKVVNEIANKKSLAHIGNIYEVLVEEYNEDNGMYTGRIDDGHLVHLKSDEDVRGKFLNVKIVDGKTFHLIGELV